MTKVLGIAGSARRHGNTEMLLDRFLAGAKQTGADVEKIVIAQLKIAGCIACDGCWDDGHCVVADDFQGVNHRLVATDVIALAAPLYFWNLPARTKALVDRGQCQWARRRVLRAPLAPTLSGHVRRRGVLICVGGDSHRYFEGIKRTVKYFFTVYEADYWGELLYHGIDAKGKIENHPSALQRAFETGRRAVEEPWS